MNEPERQIPPPPDEVLNYIAPHSDSAERDSRRAATMVGAVFTALATLILPWAWIACFSSWIISILLTAAAIAFLALLGHRSLHNRNFAFGMLFGFCFSVLIYIALGGLFFVAAYTH